MVKISKKKLERLEKTAAASGIIAAAAMDQRGSLRKALAKEKGCDPETITNEIAGQFKAIVSKVLTPHASAILLDTESGIAGIKTKHDSCGLLLAYEASGVDPSQPGKMPRLNSTLSVRRMVELGADAVKILIYYSKEEKPEINEMKQFWVERIGSECAAEEIPFYLEMLCYDANGGDGKDMAFAKKKPELVANYMAEFSKPRYKADILKVELPFNPAYINGGKGHKGGEAAYDLTEAKDLLTKAGEASKLPFIYLSAGVDDDVFRESLELAGDAGVNFAGVLCGRATWKGCMPVYAKEGFEAMEAWLNDRGVANITALNKVLADTAKPWFDKYGGRDKLEVVERTPLS